MKTPEQWLAQQIGDRPDDFSDEDRREAIEFIEWIQADAALFSLGQIVYLGICIAVTAGIVGYWLAVRS